MYIIKNIKNKNYYSKHLFGIKHFSFEEKEAIRFKDKKEAKLAMRLFRHKDNFELGLRVSETYEIYDREKEEYLYEDWLTTDDYTKWLNRTREENLEDMVAKLKYYDCKGLADYKPYSEKVLEFLKMNW